ncbi:hypothetical protein C7999DRAFT_28686 [Corynascus novoguineensis]|uniref:Uncharacterized protein n=1 Tax=Corynascus novoguineensis TaxID=1126955 RepID=A0AAN7D1F3_9PEZI|nr:hypothetical protein C7999DRAFT_28686 [Corynascus novoguineensis]
MDEKPGDCPSTGTDTGTPLASATPVGNVNRRFPRTSNKSSADQSVAQGSGGDHQYERMPTVPASMESQFKDNSVEEPLSLDELSKDPLRTHRDWYPKYGRVQKCDWCNARSEGTLHVCTTCSIRMCEKCARGRVWDKNYSHFINADTLDWKPKAVPKTPKAPRSLKAHKKIPAKRKATSEEPPPRPSCRRKLSKAAAAAAAADSEVNQEDDSAENGNKLADTSRNSRQLPTSITSHQDFIAAIHPHMPNNYYGLNPDAPNHHHHHHHHQVSMYGGDSSHARMGPTFSGYHVPPPSATASPITAEPSTRLSRRKAAARAKFNISKQTRRLSSGHGDGEGAEDGDDEYDGQHDEDDGRDAFRKRRRPEKANKVPSRRGDYSAENAGARSYHDDVCSEPMNASGSPGAADYRGHDLMVLDIYSSIYGDRPNLDYYRVRTHIPNHWVGGWQITVSQYHSNGPNPYGHGSYTVPNQLGHAYSHQASSVQAAPGHAQENTYSPAYSQHSGYQHYSDYQQYPDPHIRSPHNNPYYEIERMQQADQATLDEMRGAWAHNPVLRRFLEEGADDHNSRRAYYALDLLWDVFELRRARLPLRLLDDDSQTVGWFVRERHAQIRLEQQQHAEIAAARHHEGVLTPVRTPVYLVAAAAAPAAAPRGLSCAAQEEEEGGEEEDEAAVVVANGGGGGNSRRIASTVASGGSCARPARRTIITRNGNNAIVEEE